MVWNNTALQDFSDELNLILGQIEGHIQALNHQPDQMETIHALFRGVHTIKSNAAMCSLPAVVEFVSAMEDLISALRSRQIVFSPEIGEVILLGLDRIKLATPNDLLRHPAELFPAVAPIAFRYLAASANPSEVEGRIEGLLTLFGVEPHLKRNKIPPPPKSDILCHPASTEQQADLRFFRQVSLQMEKRSPYWEGRTGRLILLAVQTNEAAGTMIDPVQLEAAIYMHDVGMALLSESIWTNQGRFTDEEMNELRQHPGLGAGILARMPGWEAAAEIVAQHHERLDGTGYPNSLKDPEILEGAKLIAILDAFEAMTHQRIDRQYKKSVMRAMSELNAYEKQFSPQWVESFNQVVRQMLTEQ